MAAIISQVINSSGIFVTTGQLSSAQILGMFATPIQAVPAPGLGKFIAPIIAFISYTYGTMTYTYAGGTLESFFYSGNVVSPGCLIGAGLLTATASTIGTLTPQTGGDSNFSRTLVENKAIVISCTTNPFLGGDGTAKYTLYYSIQNL